MFFTNTPEIARVMESVLGPHSAICRNECVPESSNAEEHARERNARSSSSILNSFVALFR